MFESQSGENQGAFTKENLKKLADQLGLDTETFNSCFDSGKHSELIQADIAMAQQIGVQSTPSFLVNGRPIVGAQPFDEFQKVIESSMK